jgi:hypothetical protein
MSVTSLALSRGATDTTASLVPAPRVSAARRGFTELHPLEEAPLPSPPGFIRILCEVAQQRKEAR